MPAVQRTVEFDRCLAGVASGLIGAVGAVLPAAAAGADGDAGVAGVRVELDGSGGGGGHGDTGHAIAPRRLGSMSADTMHHACPPLRSGRSCSRRTSMSCVPGALTVRVRVVSVMGWVVTLTICLVVGDEANLLATARRVKRKVLAA